MGPIIATFVVAFIITAMLVTYYSHKPTAQKGSKEVIIEVVVPDEKSQEFSMYTDAQYLGEALTEVNFIKGETSEYGLFITEVKGRVADSSKKEWWCITKDGADVYTGVDQTPIADGDHYELTLKTN
jgi:hypothetical protein